MKVKLALVNLVIAFSSDLLELYCQEFDNTSLLMNKIIRIIRLTWPYKGVNSYIFVLIKSTSFSKLS